MESNYAEENFSTKQSPPRKKARFQGKDGDKERPRGHKAPPGQGPQAPDGTPLLGFGLPREARLAKRAEFLRVYEQGARIEGRFMTVFFLPSMAGRHRVGITATRKAIGKAHDRNRAKRLLRETFRLSRAELERLDTPSDFVLNARRGILRVKLEKPLAEFREIVGRIKAGDLKAIGRSEPVAPPAEPLAKQDR
jgi:ribonuclease P protein component